MYQFDRIKLIIWDLDDTFWEGTLSEGVVNVPEQHRQLLKNLTDIGIVNSICSKNDWEAVKRELKKEQLSEYFVFPSVDWSAKGGRVKELISNLQLRPANVLFLDDNVSNREEVRFFCPDIMVGSPDVISELIEQAEKQPKRDIEHKRLKQYRILEEKHLSKGAFSSNEAFLMASGIQVRVEYDCLDQMERIHELLLRSNQLNFTKVRSNLQELEALLRDDSIEKGYVSVLDSFGDYGIVGFYALRQNVLIHFTFSCRTLGMGVEQYVYNLLHRPKLSVVGEVISDLSSEELPPWINQSGGQSRAQRMMIHNLQEHAVLVKGPCDLFQIYPYIANTEMFDTEFTHTTDRGIHIESTGHTTHIVEAARLSQEQKKRIIDEVPFVDMDIYSDKIYTQPYKVVFISILTDPNLGVYRRKETGERLAFLEYIHPITDPSNWDGFVSGELRTNGFQFTMESLEAFADKYEFIGRNDAQQVAENLRYIRSKLNPECVLVVMLGGELYYEKNTYEAYMDRHIVHKQMNDAIRAFAAESRNVRLIDVNRYLVDQSNFYDHFNHYTKPVYYAMAKEMVDIVNECTGTEIKQTGRLKMLQVRLKEMLAPSFYKLKALVKR